MNDPELELVLICDNIRSLFERVTAETVSELKFESVDEPKWEEAIGEPLNWENNMPWLVRCQ